MNTQTDQSTNLYLSMTIHGDEASVEFRENGMVVLRRHGDPLATAFIELSGNQIDELAGFMEDIMGRRCAGGDA